MGEPAGPLALPQETRAALEKEGHPLREGAGPVIRRRLACLP